MESSVEGQFCMELALLDSVGGGDCKVVKFNLPETLVKPSPFVCAFDIPLKTKIVCSQPFLWLLNLHEDTQFQLGERVRRKARPSKAQPVTAAPEGL